MPGQHDETEAASGSVGELMQRLAEQTGTLVRQELHLAQLELKNKGKKAGMGAGLFGGSALLALCALGAFTAGLVLLVAEVAETWAAAFIVAGGLALIAGCFALFGKQEVGAAMPPKPEAAISGLQADVTEVKARAHA